MTWVSKYGFTNVYFSLLCQSKSYYHKHMFQTEHHFSHCSAWWIFWMAWMATLQCNMWSRCSGADSSVQQPSSSKWWEDVRRAWYRCTQLPQQAVSRYFFNELMHLLYAECPSNKQLSPWIFMIAGFFLTRCNSSWLLWKVIFSIYCLKKKKRKNEKKKK